jgi:hypothetical protein
MAMTWGQFTAQPNGTRIFNHGFDQCVALANQYHIEVLGGQFVPVGSAFQWWTSYSQLNQLTATYMQEPVTAAPQPGWVFVSRGGIYDRVHGHIGVVVRGWDGSTFGTMEQNAGTWRYLGRYNRSKSNVLGFLRPKNNPANVVVKSRGNKDMLIICKPVNEGVYKWRYAIMGPNYWMEFVSEPTARAFEAQIGAASVKVDEAFWQHCKRSTQPVSVGGSNVDSAIVAQAVNNEMARRLQA